MARFYANENFPRQIIVVLRSMGHDVLTAVEAGKANQGIPDNDVVVFAKENGRAILTINRRDFIGIHAKYSDHAGIVVCTQDPDTSGQAARINEAVASFQSLRGLLIRVNRPSR